MSEYGYGVTALLAVVQGIGEFLPISSSGHLLVLGDILGVNPEGSMRLGVVLHAGTLLSVLAVYSSELIRMVRRRDVRLVLLVLAGSAPAGLVGLGLKFSGLADRLFGNTLVAGIGFLLTAGWLFLTLRKREDRGYSLDALTLGGAFAIGFAQAFALLPGISRSGSTIGMGAGIGLRRSDAAYYSFLLMLVAVGGASLVEFLEALRSPDTCSAGVMIFGFVLSFAVGVAALSGLLGLLRRGRFGIFSLYLLLAGGATVVYSLVKGV